MLSPEEFIRIHRLLWTDPVPQSITVRGDLYPVTRADDSSRDFRSIQIGSRLIITQNLRKQSGPSRWVKGATGRKLTWIIRGGNYYAKATSEIVEGEEVTKLYLLNPDREIATFHEPQQKRAAS